jgi:shikimate kinase
MGSGGRVVGEALARTFGIDFYDKELINLASQESGLGKEFFEKADERLSQNLIGGVFSMRSPYIADGGTGRLSCLSNDALFKIQSDVIRGLVEERSCLFVGRCADYILRSHPRCVNIFITADAEDRVARIAAQNQLSKEAAKDRMVKTDKRRAEYYNYYTGKRWGAAPSYHLCVNSSLLGIEQTTDFIAGFVRKRLSSL